MDLSLKNQVLKLKFNHVIIRFMHLYVSITRWYVIITIVCHDTRLKTKYDGHLIAWELGPCKSKHIFESYKVYIQRCCVLSGTHILTCLNREKDEGWKSASLEYQQREYCNDFISFKSMSHVQVKGTTSNS